MRIVFDSMVLIHLARLGILNEKLAWYEEVLIPETVWRETTSQPEKYPDALAIAQSLLKAKNVKIIPSKYQKEQLELLGLIQGERESVSIFLEEKADFICSNDPIFRTIAPLLHLRILDTVGLIIDQTKEKSITISKGVSLLKELSRIARYSSRYIEGVQKLLEDGYFGGKNDLL